MPGTLRPIRECPKAELHICWLLPPRLVSRLSIARRLLSRCRGNPYSERPCNSKAAIKGTRERERWPNQRRVRLSKTCQGPCGLSELSLHICWLHPPRRRQRRYFALSPSQNRGIPYSDGLGRSATARSSTASQPGWGGRRVEGEWKGSGEGEFCGDVEVGERKRNRELRSCSGGRSLSGKRDLTCT